MVEVEGELNTSSRPFPLDDDGVPMPLPPNVDPRWLRLASFASTESAHVFAAMVAVFLAACDCLKISLRFC